MSVCVCVGGLLFSRENVSEIKLNLFVPSCTKVLNIYFHRILLVVEGLISDNRVLLGFWLCIFHCS